MLPDLGTSGPPYGFVDNKLPHGQINKMLTVRDDYTCKILCMAANSIKNYTALPRIHPPYHLPKTNRGLNGGEPFRSNWREL